MSPGTGGDNQRCLSDQAHGGHLDAGVVDREPEHRGDVHRDELRPQDRHADGRVVEGTEPLRAGEQVGHREEHDRHDDPSGASGKGRDGGVDLALDDVAGLAIEQIPDEASQMGSLIGGPQPVQPGKSGDHADRPRRRPLCLIAAVRRRPVATR
jgi:hypothetical protein